MTPEEYSNIKDTINGIHQEDPIIESNQPSELLYSHRMLETLIKFKPDCDYISKIAASCQHFQRWTSPRKTFPMDKKGYYQWKKHTHIKQASDVAQLLKSKGIDDSIITQITDSIQKKDLKNNPLSQLMEDITCLVFIQYYLEDFGKSYTDEKMIEIILKTWKKMSDQAQSFALKTNLKNQTRSLQLIQKALA